MKEPEAGGGGTPSSGSDDVGQRILENGDLVRQILESAENLSEPMTPETFREWLRNGMREPPLPAQPAAGPSIAQCRVVQFRG